MEDSTAVPDRSGWDAVHVRNARRGVETLGKKWRRRIEGGLAIALAIAGHGAIAYFGWGWVTSMRAPETAQTTQAVVPNQLPDPNVVRNYGDLPMTTVASVTRRRVSNDDEDPNKAALNTNRPSPAANWKCAGGYMFEKGIGADGSTVITLLYHRGKPLSCQN